MNRGRETQTKRRSGAAVMGALIGLVKPLLPVMLLAIFLGIIGYLCAIFVTILGGYGVIHAVGALLGMDMNTGAGTFLAGMEPRALFIILIVIAVARGLLHYGEQYCNHFIAFRLLAIIRHKVFAKLRKLCPAKLEGKDTGNLISIITSDIELLEVFYAHTISPIAIGTVVSVIMVIFIGRQNLFAGILAACGYLVVGVIIPLWNGRRGADEGMRFRDEFGNLNSFVLESLYGLEETIRYGCGEKRKAEMDERSRQMGGMQKKLNRLEASQRSVTNLAIQIFSIWMFVLMMLQYMNGGVGSAQVIICTIAMMSSFGPVVALSNLSNNLNQTLACGERVLSLLEEEPQVEEVFAGVDTAFTGARTSHVDFAYDDEQILSDYTITIPKGKIVGIHGASGSGKSTLLKLLMRFWDVQAGQVTISEKDIREMVTKDLRDLESYVTQETWLFHDSIANNIAVGKQDATREEIEAAAKKASIHDFIMTLPEGYDTNVGELGDTLSGGERQRIGIARAFLHDAPFMLLDEPTSNLDSLNEGIILKALKESKKDETVLLVSHRRSTLGIADTIAEMDGERVS